MRRKYQTRKTSFIVIASFITLLIIYILLSQLINKNQTEKKLSQFGFEDISIEELVEGLDSGEIYKSNLNASITGSTLKLSDGDSSANIEIDNGKFYVSFAPYINRTHPCANHNLITCSSELANVEFDVVIISSNGVIIYDQTITSMNNGFIGLWLPENITGTIIVNYQGLNAEVRIETFSNSNTCITTPLKLN